MVFGNVGTIISFRIGAEDTKVMAKEFYPVFGESDLTNLPNYHIYLKMMIDGKLSRPFSAITMPGPERRGSHKEKIIELSRRRYGRIKKIAENEIFLRNNY